MDFLRMPPKRRLVALVAVLLAIAAGAGGYALGKSTGADLEAARAQGARSGKVEGADRGSQKGYDQGFEAGFRQAKARGYRNAFYKALSAAGIKPAQLVSGGVGP
jgi:hypothetical protein